MHKPENPKCCHVKNKEGVVFLFNKGELEEKKPMILISEFSVSLSVLCQNIKLFPCYRKDLYMQRDVRLHNIYIVFILQTAHPHSPFLILHLRLQNSRKYLLILLLPLTPVSRNNFYTPKRPNPTIILRAALPSCPPPQTGVCWAAAPGPAEFSCNYNSCNSSCLAFSFQAVFWGVLAEGNEQTSKSHLQQCWHLLTHSDASLTDRLAPGWKS